MIFKHNLLRTELNWVHCNSNQNTLPRLYGVERGARRDIHTRMCYKPGGVAQRSKVSLQGGRKIVLSGGAEKWTCPPPWPLATWLYIALYHTYGGQRVKSGGAAASLASMLPTPRSVPQQHRSMICTSVHRCYCTYCVTYDSHGTDGRP